MPATTAPKIFLEAVFIPQNDKAKKIPREWSDNSTQEYYVFHSGFGAIRLRRRTIYPNTFAYIRGDSLVFGYGNSDKGENLSTQHLGTVDDSTFYESEFLYIDANCATGAVYVQRDAFCTLPLFIACQNAQLFLANRIERLYQLLDTTQLHIGGGLSYYLLNIPLNNQTFFTDINLLGERHRLEWRAGNLAISQPPNSRIADVFCGPAGNPHNFRQQLERTFDRYKDLYAGYGAKAAVLMSTGLDSTTIAGYFADTGCPLPWATVCHSGENGIQQKRQIQDMSHRFKGDCAIYDMDIDIDFPLGNLARSRQWQPVFHNQETFEVFHRLAVSLSEQGFNTLFMGFGGDELCSKNILLSTRETLRFPASKPTFLTPHFVAYAQQYFGQNYAKPSPLPLICPSLSDINTNFYNLFLDFNIWPVSPLSDPKLYRYAQSLHGIYRKDKNILRGYQLARHFPKSIYGAASKEHFATFFHQAVTRKLRPVIQLFFDKSILGNLNIINTNEAYNVFLASQASPTVANFLNIYDVYRLLVAEINLQTLQIQSSNF